MATVCFSSACLKNTNKQGILKPDADGYYFVVLGGLNILNSVNEFYTAQGATELFQKSSDLMRCVTNGNLKGENGHPKPMPGEDEEAYFRRAMTIEETNVSHHIRSVELDTEFGKKNPKYGNPDIVGILGWIRPAGPHAAALKDALDNKHENVNFSIRSLTRNNYKAGRMIKTLEYIRTWDWVTEPGLPVANKYASPSLESFVDLGLSERILMSMIDNKRSPLSMESSNRMAHVALELVREEKAKRAPKPDPIWTGW